MLDSLSGRKKKERNWKTRGVEKYSGGENYHARGITQPRVHLKIALHAVHGVSRAIDPSLKMPDLNIYTREHCETADGVSIRRSVSSFRNCLYPSE